MVEPGGATAYTDDDLGAPRRLECVENRKKGRFAETQVRRRAYLGCMIFSVRHGFLLAALLAIACEGRTSNHGGVADAARDVGSVRDADGPGADAKVFDGGQ